MVAHTCRICGLNFSYEPVFYAGTLQEVITRKYCDECIPRMEAKGSMAAAENVAQEREKAWLEICPPLYRETDAVRLPMNPAPLAKVLKWKGGGSRGIALAGATGVGKTRAMFLLLHRLHWEGHHVTAVTAKRFERYVHQMFEKDNEARDMIRRAHRADILYIDDIGKEKYTERVESEFHDLIETRTANLRPILWTANNNGTGLEAMMSPERGAPILRRLREFTEIITL